MVSLAGQLALQEFKEVLLKLLVVLQGTLWT